MAPGTFLLTSDPETDIKIKELNRRNPPPPFLLFINLIGKRGENDAISFVNNKVGNNIIVHSCILVPTQFVNRYQGYFNIAYCIVNKCTACIKFKFSYSAFEAWPT